MHELSRDNRIGRPEVLHDFSRDERNDCGVTGLLRYLYRVSPGAEDGGIGLCRESEHGDARDKSAFHGDASLGMSRRKDLTVAGNYEKMAGMNQQRRNRLEELRDKLTDLKTELEVLRDEEQEYLDNMPDGIASGEKGQKAEASIEIMEDAASSMEDAIDYLSNVE